MTDPIEPNDSDKQADRDEAARLAALLEQIPARIVLPPRIELVSNT
jgi:hypothetical protein